MRLHMVYTLVESTPQRFRAAAAKPFSRQRDAAEEAIVFAEAEKQTPRPLKQDAAARCLCVYAAVCPIV